jgi:AcrR family transcriptional regulator
MGTSPQRLGREGTVEALLDAAEELFAARGPAAVSLRDIARHANVNLGLIHHYIGSRDDLLHLVFARSTERARQTVMDAVDPSDALSRLRALGGTNDRYTRLLSWALLEGHDPRDFHGRSAALETISTGQGHDSRDLRVALAMAMVQTLGWKLFGDYVTVAAGLDAEDPHSIRDEIDALVRAMVAEKVAGVDVR